LNKRRPFGGAAFILWFKNSLNQFKQIDVRIIRTESVRIVLMNRNLSFLLLAFSILIVGCSKTPTSPSSGQWGEATANAFSSGRYGLTGTVFGGQMWAIGGASGPVTTYYSDVYSSGNGFNWTKVNGSAAFGGRYGSQVLSYSGKLWLIGGNNSGTLMNDVWTSADGNSWTRLLAPTKAGTASQFSPREDFGALVYNNAMWVIGGFSQGSSNNDVWSSTDGVTWTQVLANGPPSVTQFSKRWGISTTVYNNAMWVMTGAYSTVPNSDPTTVYSDVWTSSTGASWTRLSIANIFDSIYYSQGAVFNNQVWLTGGYLAGFGARSLADYTTDGVNWTGTWGSFPFRFDHLTLSFNNSLWVIAGCDNVCQSTSCAVTYLNDVWYTQ
jgi:hypothetical protein